MAPTTLGGDWALDARVAGHVLLGPPDEHDLIVIPRVEQQRQIMDVTGDRVPIPPG